MLSRWIGLLPGQVLPRLRSFSGVRRGGGGWWCFGGGGSDARRAVTWWRARVVPAVAFSFGRILSCSKAALGAGSRGGVSHFCILCRSTVVMERGCASSVAITLFTVPHSSVTATQDGESGPNQRYCSTGCPVGGGAVLVRERWFRPASGTPHSQRKVPLRLPCLDSSAQFRERTIRRGRFRPVGPAQASPPRPVPPKPDQLGAEPL